KAVITQELSTDRKSTTNGIIAGVLPVEPLINELQKIAGTFSKDLCMGSTFQSIAEQLRQQADMNSDGTNTPGKDCDAISIGLGFEGKAVQLGAIAPKAMPKPDPCTGGGGAGGAPK